MDKCTGRHEITGIILDNSVKHRRINLNLELSHTDRGPREKEFHQTPAILMPILETMSCRKPNLELVREIDESDESMHEI